MPKGIWASLHKREKDLQEKAKTMAQREQELQQRESVFKKGRYTPREALKAIGYEDFDDFIKTVAENGGEWTPEQQKIHELESRLAASEQTEKERRKQAEEEQQALQTKNLIDAWHKDILAHVSGSEWKDSLVSLPGTEQTVFNVIQDHYQQTGERMEYDDACQLVNQHMEQELQQAVKNIAANPRGRAIVQEFAESLMPQPKRGKSTAQGLTPTVRQPTRSDPLEDMDLDEAVAATISANRRAQR